ncbi:MAG: class I SAM-dependent methyltransferase, partial [Pseudomonadota bacterium]
WNRGAEAKRADRLIDDPLSADLIDRIDYDFRRRFGRPNAFHPVRARVADDLIRDYLSRTPAAPVVALGEGLEGQLWRLDDAPRAWISVDLPQAIAVRRRLLPEDPRQTLVACSALDHAWMDAVPQNAPPFIAAAGLLMYFDEAAVIDLLTGVARRFPSAELFFDVIPPFFSQRTLKGQKVTKDYTAPPMPWGVSIDHVGAFVASIPGLTPVRVQSYVEPFPDRMRLYSFLARFGAIRRALSPGLVHARVDA